MKKLIIKRLGLLFFVCAGFLFTAGCQSTYYKAMEKIGYHKRDLLVGRVQDARDSQEEAKEQFKSALEQFKTVMAFDGGDLEEKYNALNLEYERSEAKAEAVADRIDSVQSVAEALFTEWKAELKQYSNAKLRRSSQNSLIKTERHYKRLINAMKRAEKKISPVLSAFKDQVLFLKHNLNARAIASLQGELVTVESDVAKLIKEMESSISEANQFISTMNKES